MKTPYDVSASWEDPYERRQDRRSAARTAVGFVVKIGVDLANKPTPLVGPGVVDDMSVDGLRCRTKHRLAPGQHVRLLIPTKELPEQLGLPKKFMGGAQVVRSTPMSDGVSEISFRFDEQLRDDIHLAVFVEHMQNVGRVANA